MITTILDSEDYRDFVATLSNDFRKLALDGKKPSLREVVDFLRPNEENRVIRNLCAELDIATKPEFDREIQRSRQRAVLGTAPANATELVKAYVDRHCVVARYNGLLSREVRATWVDPHTGQTTPITHADREAATDVDLYAAFHCDAKARMNRQDLERDLRILSETYRMGIGANAITDAVDEWLKEAYRSRLHDIFVGVNGKEPRFDAPASWLRFADEVFDCSETSPDFVAAEWRMFIWQVKRKMLGLPVFDHLMPVILGPQGAGKSTLVNRVVEPIKELMMNVDFVMITDGRNHEIWSSFVLFLDEMGYASKADIDTVKNVITAPTLTRRPMCSNGTVTIEQKATLIGCSNKELAQLIRDPTGIRRFVGIRMRSDANRELINALDWALMWGSVRADEVNPMAAHRATLVALQEGSRERGRVEQWMVDFDATSHAYQAHITKTGNIAGKDLYTTFRDYEDERYPGHAKTSKTDWEHEMARLRKNSPEVMIFTQTRAAKGMTYRWEGESRLRLAN